MKLEKIFSLKVLIGIGFVIAMIPLFLAIMYADFAMRQTTALGERAIYQVLAQAKTARSVVRRVADVERKARLFVLLAEPSLRQPYERQSYESVRASLQDALAELRTLRIDSKTRLLANEVSEKERLIYEQIMNSANDKHLRLPVDQAFEGLRDAANTLWQEVVGRVEGEVNELRGQSRAVQRLFLVKGAALLLVSVIFMLAVLVVLTRSIRQLDDAIRRMGSGNFAAPIQVSGPRDLRHLGDQLDWLRKRLVELDDSKQQFIRSVCHEIEAPLLSASEISGLFAREMASELSHEQRELSSVLHDNVKKLKSLFEELSSYGLVNVNQSQQTRRSVNLKELYESVMEAYQDELSGKSLVVKALVQPVECFGIPEQLRALVDNLIANAVRYSPEGGEIQVILRASGDQVELEVEDEGVGIQADERKHMFEPFFRRKGAKLGDEGVKGLGLAIVNECVANHHGKLEIVEPGPDKHGVRIRVMIPLAKAL